ncbi:MAG: type II toxin-antitoxin system PemK/MazF family toxin [Chloroflexi bacterium]|nr:type II toxin-antitoxin system PemK/MazF family toxin [Chloroflexota bacterium]MBI4506148.1 type II toxin-antitoxin system PemK/MazF family toxin [Chloroflexota bacterium]
MRRGEVWWADLPAPIGRRPVLLLSRDVAYRVRASVTVGVVTRAVRGIATEVPLGPADGMPVACVVNLDDILTIPKRLLQQRITSLSAENMAHVAEAIAFALDLPSGAANR